MENRLLQEVLEARENRKKRQQELLAHYQKPLVCFTLNIPGDEKRSPLIDFAFHWGIRQIQATLGPFLKEDVCQSVAGNEYYAVCRCSAEEAKRQALLLESEPSIGRLLDIDVLQENGEKLSRGAMRTCLICGGPVSVCSRSRAHGLPALKEKVESILRAFAVTALADAAVEALKEEVHLTPKPGLVDDNNNGAHTDMDPALFERSAEALRPYWETAVRLGMEDPGHMEPLQKAGLQAEQTMYAATGGINTHKGAVYAFGLLLSALGTTLTQGGDPFALAAQLAKDGISSNELTHGQKVYRTYGILGAREEAESGFPHVKETLQRLRDGMSPQRALMFLYRDCPDTNLYYRGGVEGVQWTREKAQAILDAPLEQQESLLLSLDRDMIAAHLSPGGCADLLALSLFLRSLPFSVTCSHPSSPAV